ncbi:MAG: hypothetical protein ACRD0K_05765 [Egibacteraceae bacterium]
MSAGRLLGDPGAVLAHAGGAPSVLAHAGGAPSGLAPLPLLLLAATGAVAAVAALVAHRSPATPGPGLLLPPALTQAADGRAARLALRLAGTAGAAALLVSAVLGSPALAARAANIALFDFWAWLAVASLLLGPVWRLVNPFRAQLLRLSGDAVRPPPSGLGWWPAAAGLLATAWVALVLPGRPLVFVVLIAVLTLVQLGGVAVYGPRWLDLGDPLEAYSAVLGAVAPVRRTAQGRLHLASPRHRLATLAAPPGTAAVCGALIGWYAADAIVETETWHAITFPAGSLLIARSAVLLACAAAVGLLAAATTSRRGLAPALLPIAAGWALGHHLAPLAPAVSLAGLVAGHLGAIVVAHDRAVARYGARAAAAQLELRALVLTLLVAGLALRYGGL